MAGTNFIESRHHWPGRRIEGEVTRQSDLLPGRVRGGSGGRGGLGGDGLGVCRHHLVDARGHQVRAHVTAQVAVGHNAGEVAALVDDADAAESLRGHLHQRVGHFGAERL